MFHSVEVILGLLALAVTLGVLARWLKLAYPILLVCGGLLIGLQPGAPPLTLDPKIVFLLFLPPLLYAGAFRTEWPEFRSQIRAISLLAVGLVLFSTTLVAVAAHHWIGMSWGTAFVLGAIVSPPDAVAAMAITQRIRVPKIITTLLEGESLVNDASALVILRLAVAAVAVGTFSIVEAGIEFVVVSVGGIAIGLVGAVLIIRLMRWLDRTKLADSKLEITITLLTPFAVYLPAEHLEVSGVLAAVTAGFWIGNRCEHVFRRELYEESRVVWEWIEFLLNSLIFILIGFELRDMLDSSDNYQGSVTPAQMLSSAAIICAVVIVARLAWIFPGAYLPRWIDRTVFGVPVQYPPWQNVFVVGWTGMRGVVSLAAALAIPEFTASGKPFPDRDLIQFLTFCVIFVTLVGQGLTLPVIIRVLGVSDPPPPGNESPPEYETQRDGPASTE